MQIDDKIEVIKLFEIYGCLLTEKKVKLFELYFCEDLSINEIADEFGISKNAVYNSVIDSAKKLKQYEEKLNIYSKYVHNISLLKKNEVQYQIIQKIL